LIASLSEAEVGVDLGGREGLVAQEFLDAAEVRAVVEEVGGEGVAEGVGGDGGVQADLDEVLVELAADGAGAEALAVLVEEEGDIADLVSSAQMGAKRLIFSRSPCV
jgi:hypothetical protein